MYKVMALDVGTKRIGVALSDFLLMLSNGHSCIARQPENKAVEEILKIAKENHVKNYCRASHKYGWHSRLSSAGLQRLCSKNHRL